LILLAVLGVGKALIRSWLTDGKAWHEVRLICDPVRVIIMRPDQHAVCGARDQTEQFSRVTHMIQDTARDTDIEAAFDGSQIWEKITKQKSGPLHPQQFLGHQTFKKARCICLDRHNLTRAVLLDQVGLCGFERPELQHRTIGKTAKLRISPRDPRVWICQCCTGGDAKLRGKRR
jgi:hypothetical protein